MRVIQLLSSTNASEVVAAHNAYYVSVDSVDNDNILSTEYYKEFMQLIKTKVLVETGMVITVDHFVNLYDDPTDNTDEVHVGARIDGAEFSMSFIPWSEVLAAEYECGNDMSPAEVAAHIFWELTWHGMELDMEVRRDDLFDAVEELDRDLAALEEGEDLPHTYRSMDDIWDTLYLDQTEEDKERRRTELDRRVANYRTVKTYKNGVLVEKINDDT